MADYDDDPNAAARGISCALLMSIPIWALIILVAYLIVTYIGG